MTKAVCLNCGEIKFGAFNKCQSCGFQPDTPESQGKHVLVTDHYYSAEELDQISERVKAGEALAFDPAAVEEATRAAAVLLPPPGGRARSWLVVLAIVVVAVIVVVIWTR